MALKQPPLSKLCCNASCVASLLLPDVFSLLAAGSSDAAEQMKFKFNFSIDKDVLIAILSLAYILVEKLLL